LRLSDKPQWITPLSAELERTCVRAQALATERRLPASATDFLCALIDDPDCVAVIDACAVDRAALRATLEGLARKARGSVPNAGYLPILDRMSAHMRSASRNDTLTGAHALAAIMMLPGTAGAAALQQHGLTRFDVLRFIAHGLRKGETAPDEGDTVRATMLAVKIRNDDYTPMEFVVAAIERFFDRDRESAARIMISVHQTGSGTCGSYPAVVARAKAAEVAAFARDHEHPLCCVVAAVTPPSS
jgi:ATP-dependent Clp protease adaptor protein ClpS